MLNKFCIGCMNEQTAVITENTRHTQGRGDCPKAGTSGAGDKQTP